MTNVDRKAAAREFRERVASRGIFALRCAAIGRAWVGASRNLENEDRRVRFFLNQGGHRDRDLQTAWASAGDTAFVFEVLERLDDDTPDMLVADRLKAGTARWAAALGAPVLLP